MGEAQRFGRDGVIWDYYRASPSDDELSWNRRRSECRKEVEPVFSGGTKGEGARVEGEEEEKEEWEWEWEGKQKNKGCRNQNVSVMVSFSNDLKKE